MFEQNGKEFIIKLINSEIELKAKTNEVSYKALIGIIIMDLKQTQPFILKIINLIINSSE